MKKSLLAVAFAMVAMASSAQIYVGGTLGYNSTTEKRSYDGTTTTHGTRSTLTFAPEVGWIMDETWSFGLSFNYASNSSKDKLANPNVSTSSSNWSVNPYARYTFYTAGNISCFADGVLGVGAPNEDYTTISVAVRPGVALGLTENISLVSTVNLLGWTSTTYNKDKRKSSSSNFYLDANTSALSFSLYYTF